MRPGALLKVLLTIGRPYFYTFYLRHMPQQGLQLHYQQSHDFLVIGKFFITKNSCRFIYTI